MPEFTTLDKFDLDVLRMDMDNMRRQLDFLNEKMLEHIVENKGNHVI